MDTLDTDEFKRRVEELYPRLYQSMSAYLAGSSVEAEDILQEAFMNAYQKKDEFRGNSAFYTWIYSIARNLAIDEFRKRKHQNLQVETPIEDMEVAADEPRPETNSEEILKLRQAISRLPEKLRSVVILRTVDGFTYQEIEEITGVKEATMKNRMYRARLELATLLKEMGVQ